MFKPNHIRADLVHLPSEFQRHAVCFVLILGPWKSPYNKNGTDEWQRWPSKKELQYLQCWWQSITAPNILFTVYRSCNSCGKICDTVLFEHRYYYTNKYSLWSCMALPYLQSLSFDSQMSCHSSTMHRQYCLTKLATWRTAGWMCSRVMALLELELQSTHWKSFTLLTDV